MAYSRPVLHNPVSGERFAAEVAAPGAGRAGGTHPGPARPGSCRPAAARPGGARVTARQRATGTHGEPS